jgi:putative transposase
MSKQKKDLILGHELEEIIPDAAIRQKFIDQLYKKEDLFSDGSIFRSLLQGFVNGALDGEMAAHLDENKELKNRKNGKSRKKVRSQSGELSIETPRDRDGSFEPKLVGKWQRELTTGLDNVILSFYAQGQSIEDIRQQLQNLYGLEVSAGTISAITEKVWTSINEWQNRALHSCYPIIYLDAIHYNVRQDGKIIPKAVYTIYGIDQDGERDILGLYMNNAEGARHWGMILEDLKRRGVTDVFIFCVDGLKGFKEVIGEVFPHSNVQRCIVHMIRYSTRFISYKDIKKVCADLRLIYSAVDVNQALIALESFEQKWNKQYPEVAKSWRDNWDELMFFMSFSTHIRRMIYTTNPVEAVHRLMRKTTKAKGAWISDNALIKQLYLTLTYNEKSWKRKAFNWVAIQRELIDFYGERYEKHL